jgi:hypothetical protein
VFILKTVTGVIIRRTSQVLISNNFPQASHKGVKEEAQASWKKWSASCGGASHSLVWKRKSGSKAAALQDVAIFPKQSLPYI